MAQISIYIDDHTLKQIEKAAKKDRDSISRWVKKQLVSSIKSAWPKDYFDILGSLHDDSFKRPLQIDSSKEQALMEDWVI
jgi:hypothetical protein